MNGNILSIIVIVGIIILFIGAGVVQGVNNQEKIIFNNKSEKLNMSDTLDQSQEVFDTYCIFGTYVTHYNINWHAFQSFQPQLGKLTRVEIFLCKDNQDPAVKSANLVIKEDLLHGDDLAMSNVSYTQIPSYGNPKWIEFDFPDISVTVGHTYYIVCSVDWIPVKDSSYLWGCTYYDSYDFGISGYSRDGGESFRVYDHDFCFRTYGRAPELEISEIKGGFGKVSADIKNNLDHTIEDIECTITVTGGILNLINVESEETIDSLESGNSITISSNGFIFGLGPIQIEITAESDEVGKFSRIETDWVILFLVI